MLRTAAAAVFSTALPARVIREHGLFGRRALGADRIESPCCYVIVAGLCVSAFIDDILNKVRRYRAADNESSLMKTASASKVCSWAPGNCKTVWSVANLGTLRCLHTLRRLQLGKLESEIVSDDTLIITDVDDEEFFQWEKQWRPDTY